MNMHYYALRDVAWDVPLPPQEMAAPMPRYFCEGCMTWASSDACNVPKIAPKALLKALATLTGLGTPKSMCPVHAVEEAIACGRLSRAFMEARDRRRITHPEFVAIVKIIRSLLYVDVDHLILPGSFVGPITLPKTLDRCRLDIVGGFPLGEVICSERLKGFLEEHGITGLHFYPTYFANGNPAPMFELEVADRRYVPVVLGDGRWQHCDVCGELWFEGDRSSRLALADGDADVLDFFRFASKGPIYCSSRVVESLTRSGMSLGIEFVPSCEIQAIAEEYIRI